MFEFGSLVTPDLLINSANVIAARMIVAKNAVKWWVRDNAIEANENKIPILRSCFCRNSKINAMMIGLANASLVTPEVKRVKE